MRRLVVFAALAALVACAERGPSSPGPTKDGGSGIEGRVVAGPICPVEIASSPCPPQPIRARVFAEPPEGAPGQSAETDDEGRFRMELPPGEYLVTAQSVEGSTRSSKPMIVSVPSGRYLSVDLVVDTGIRGPD